MTIFYSIISMKKVINTNKEVLTKSLAYYSRTSISFLISSFQVTILCFYSMRRLILSIWIRRYDILNCVQKILTIRICENLFPKFHQNYFTSRSLQLITLKLHKQHPNQKTQKKLGYLLDFTLAEQNSQVITHTLVRNLIHVSKTKFSSYYSSYVLSSLSIIVGLFLEIISSQCALWYRN